MTYPLRQQARQRVSQPKKWPAPTAGLISNRNLASPGSFEGQGAAVLDNFFPKASSVTLRRGKQLYATLGDGTLRADALFSYVNGITQRLFAATETTIYDVTSVVFPESAVIVDQDNDQLVTENGDIFGWSSTDGLDVTTVGPFTSGAWITTQFATTGGVYLIGVNGADTDEWLLPERLLTLGLVWRWRENKGLATNDQQAFIKALDEYGAKDSGSKVIARNSYSTPRLRTYTAWPYMLGGNGYQPV